MYAVRRRRGRPFSATKSSGKADGEKEETELIDQQLYSEVSVMGKRFLRRRFADGKSQGKSHSLNKQIAVHFRGIGRQIHPFGSCYNSIKGRGVMT